MKIILLFVFLVTSLNAQVSDRQMREFVAGVRRIHETAFTQESIHEAYQVAEYAFNSAKGTRKIEDKQYFLNIGWAALNGVGFGGLSKDPLRKANAEEKSRATRFMLLLGAMDDNHIIVRAQKGACEAHQQHYDYLRTVYLNGKGKKYNPAFPVSPLVAAIVPETEIEEFIAPFRVMDLDALPLMPFDGYTGYLRVRNAQPDSFEDFCKFMSNLYDICTHPEDSIPTLRLLEEIQGIDLGVSGKFKDESSFVLNLSRLFTPTVISDVDDFVFKVGDKDMLGGLARWVRNAARGYFSTLDTLSSLDTSAVPEEVKEEAENLRDELESQFSISSLLSDSGEVHNYQHLNFLTNALKFYASSEDAVRAKNAGLIFTTLEAIKSGSIRGVREYSIYLDLFVRLERVVSTSIVSRAAELELDPATVPYREVIDLSYTPPSGGRRVEISGSLLEFWDSLLKTECEYFYPLCQQGDFSRAGAVVELLTDKIGSYTQNAHANVTGNLFEHEGRYWTLESLSAEAFALAYADWLLTSSPDERARFGGDQLFFLEPYRWVKSQECIEIEDISVLATVVKDLWSKNIPYRVVEIGDKHFKVLILTKTPEHDASITRMYGAFKSAKDSGLPVYTSVMLTGKPGVEGHYVTLVFEPGKEGDKLTMIDPFGDYEESITGARTPSRNRKDRYEPLLRSSVADINARGGIKITAVDYIASGQQESPNSCGIIALLMAQKIAREGVLTDSNFLMEPWNDGSFSSRVSDRKHSSYTERVRAEQDYVRRLLSLVESGALAELIAKFAVDPVVAVDEVYG